MAGGHLFSDVAIEQRAERDVAGTGILGFVVQLQDEAFEVMPKSLFGFVESPVEGQRLMNPIVVLDGVVAILPHESPGSLDPPQRAVLVPLSRPFDGCRLVRLQGRFILKMG